MIRRLPGRGQCPQVVGQNALDTPLGAAGGRPPVSLRAVATAPEPDLSDRYRVPVRPSDPVDHVRAGEAIVTALQELQLSPLAYRVLASAEGWPASLRMGLAELIEAARDAGAAPYLAGGTR